MGAAPLNWLLKIGGETLKTTAKTLSEAVNTLHDSVTSLSTTVTNLGTSKADASTTTTALNNLETSKLNVSDLLSLEEIEASTSLTGKGVTAESVKSLNSSLSEKVSGFTSDTYEAVTGLAYDATNKKLGLKVGADTVIPFKKGFIPETAIRNYTVDYVKSLEITPNFTGKALLFVTSYANSVYVEHSLESGMKNAVKLLQSYGSSGVSNTLWIGDVTENTAISIISANPSSWWTNNLVQIG